MVNTSDTADPAEVAASLRTILAAIESGELTASTTYRARLEGAVVALDLMAGGEVGEIVDRLATI